MWPGVGVGWGGGRVGRIDKGSRGREDNGRRILVRTFDFFFEFARMTFSLSKILIFFGLKKKNKKIFLI